ncbi:MAG: L-aspartate oxidase [Pseudomonadota bacterium]|nr:L-aspartate oxidase [Pseudomonadota bacterium]
MRPVIIGAGLAGLTAALCLAPEPVLLLSSRKLGNATSSAWAQGGVAAAVGNEDSPALHAEDTLKAGAGLCDAEVVRQVTEQGPAVIEWLLGKGVAFDHDATGWRLGLEGGHSRRRILHAAGDSTGLAIMKALIAAVNATPSIEVIEDVRATELCTADRTITGLVVERGGERSIIETQRLILATGGAGALWRQTTNPLGSWGPGLILAARAGALLGDLEFVQFHPTAIDCGRDPMPLASEALRGEGAVLIDENGKRFMEGQGRAELEPRDVVARAIWNHMLEGHTVYLDARTSIGAKFPRDFPFIYALCGSAGLDPARQPIPVRPAAHYHMGGVVSDPRGRTNIKGLWVCGEVACTGLHGANRLASNSLLEAVTSGQGVARDVATFETGLGPRPSAPPVHTNEATRISPASQEIRDTMSAHLGVLRHEAGLQKAIGLLEPLAIHSGMALAGLLIATAALKRTESRGAHTRSDFPITSLEWARRQTISLENLTATARPSPAPAELKAETASHSAGAAL